jgi:hypothetical protein
MYSTKLYEIFIFLSIDHNILKYEAHNQPLRLSSITR